MCDDDYDPEPDASYVLYEKGTELMKEGRWEEALKHFNDSYALQYHGGTLTKMGICLMELNEIPEAIKALAAATALRAVGEPTIVLAELFLRLEDYRYAVKFALETLKREPGNRRAIKVLSHKGIHALVAGIESNWKESGEEYPLAKQLRELGLYP